MRVLPPILMAAGLLAATTSSFAADQETATYAVDTEIKVVSDQRTRGISDSLNNPGARLSVQAAHASGLIGLFELSSVSKKQFLDGDGADVTLGAGYRFGNPEGWHFGVGLAAEIFPGAGFLAPHAIDPDTGMPTDVRRTNFNSEFAVLEIGYGAIEGRILNVLSKTYRGIDTGGVCGQMLATMADPTRALECYGRGDHNSRGSWLFDLDYNYDLTPTTKLNLHGGYQLINHFKEANFADFRVGLTHKRWGFDWTVAWVGTRVRTRELYLVQDGDAMRPTDSNKLVFAVSRKF
ncbi:TorF family putative porin (plasmid) [Ralstonia sp. R-29]|uniref:TorF family putative porin n=1 Tax=Ralstonia sp. R-29 TaxID=3404059 RepID=UPI003CEEA117